MRSDASFIRGWTFALAALGTISAWQVAGEALPAAPAPPPVKSAPALHSVSPAAQAVMDRRIAALKGLDSFSADIHRTEQIDEDSGPVEERDMSLAFRRPALVDLSVARLRHIMADGASIHYPPGSDGREGTKPAPPTVDAVLLAVGKSLKEEDALLRVLAGGYPLRFCDIPNVRWTMSVGSAQDIRGVDVDVLVIAGFGESAHLAVGQADHLPRRLTVTDENSRVTWDLSNVQVNPSLDMHRFVYGPQPDPFTPEVARIWDAGIHAAGAWRTLSYTIASRKGSQTPVTCRVTLRRPNLVRIEATQGARTETIVSDSARMFTFDTTDPVHYRGEAAPRDLNSLERRYEAGILQLPVGLFAMQWTPAGLTGIKEGRYTLDYKVRAERGVMGGTPVDRLQMELANEPGMKEQCCFAFGTADHLARQCKYILSGGGIWVATAEDVRIDAAVPDTTFHFVPPHGSHLLNAVFGDFDLMYDSATSLKRGPGASATLYGNPPVLKSWPAGLRELHGAPIHQKAYDNKVVVLFFWAPFFPPSVQKLAAFQTIYGEYHSQGLEMLGVSLDEPRQQDAVLRWLHTFDITSPQVYDGLMWQTPLARLYGIHSAPTALVIGRDGIVHYVSEGSVDSGLTQAIEQALATAQSSSSRLGFGRSLTG